MTLQTIEDTYSSETINSVYSKTLNGTPQGTTSGTGDGPLSSRLVKGEFTPNYNKLVKEGAFIPYNQWHKETHEGTAVNGNFSWSRPDGWVYSGTYAPVHDWRINSNDLDLITVNPNYDAFVNEALDRIYSKGYDALTFVAELGKLITMFRRLIPRLASLVSETITNPKLRPEEVRNLWLEVRYGWRPLIYDMRDFTQTLEEFDAERRFYTERSGDTFQGEFETVHWDNIVQQYGTWDSRSSISWELSARGSAALLVTPPKFQTNPVTTAWELVPYSFVIDWFFDIGSFLGSLSALAISSDVTVAHGSYLKISKVTNMSMVATNGASGSLTFSEPMVHTMEKTLRVPSQPSYLPQFNVNLNTYKILDLVALAFRSK